MKTSGRARRILCLWLPDWPVQRRIAANPALERVLLWVTATTSRGEFVGFGNELSRKRGVRPGLPVSEARSLVRPHDSVVATPLDPPNETQGLVELAAECEAYSYRIGLDDLENPSGLVMDVTGVAQFFGGELFLAEDLRRRLSERRLEGRIALADTVGAAWAAARFLAAAGEPAIIPEGSGTLLDALPVEGLRFEERTLSRLRRLGLRTIGQVRTLDRSTIPSRFGPEFLQRVDQFTGERPELILPCRPAPTFRVSRRFDEGFCQREAIERLGLLLLEELLETLRAQRLGTRILQCRFDLANHASHDVTLRLCDAANDVRRVQDLLRLQLERLSWDVPLTGLGIAAQEVGPLEPPQGEFFDGGSRDRDRQFHALLDRLGNRLGEGAVLRVRLGTDPVPENAVEYWPVVKERSAGSGTNANAKRLWPLDRPTALHPRPRRVEVVASFPDGPPAMLHWNGARYDVTRHWGPERIESGWWQGDEVRRDYYRVETTEGRRWWLFRRLTDGRWFWHGELM